MRRAPVHLDAFASVRDWFGRAAKALLEELGEAPQSLTPAPQLPLEYPSFALLLWRIDPVAALVEFCGRHERSQRVHEPGDVFRARREVRDAGSKCRCLSAKKRLGDPSLLLSPQLRDDTFR